jgi:SAM-dependent methyltransferase
MKTTALRRDGVVKLAQNEARTVERFHGLEGADSVEAIMHVHRYRLATAFAAGRRVLDFGTGDGYGARMMAETASTVVGLDQDAATIAEAQQKYPHANLEFRVGNTSTLEKLEPGSFDLLTSFEMLEHVDAPEQERLVSLFARVVGERGVVVASTPNGEVKTRHYAAFPDWRNPFHVRELSRDELMGLFKSHFRCVDIRPQAVEVASLIDVGSPEPIEVPSAAAWVNVVVASQQPVEWPKAPPATLPHQMQLFEEYLRTDRKKVHELERMGVEVQRLNQLATRLHQDLAQLNATSAAERQRLLGELDGVTRNFVTARRREHELTEQLEQLTVAYRHIEQSLSHRISVFFDHFPRTKQAIIHLGNAIRR